MATDWGEAPLIHLSAGTRWGQTYKGSLYSKGGEAGAGGTPVEVARRTTGRTIKGSEQEPWEVVALFSSVNRSLVR
jgi:hypothetical protein